MMCDTIRSALNAFGKCTKTEDGFRVTTQCLYPSFEPVGVFIVGFADGFKVHDGGGAVQSVWDHGRDISTARRALAAEASTHHLQVIEDALVGEAPSREWLVPTILSVANASASAAFAATARLAIGNEESLKSQIFEILTASMPTNLIDRGWEAFGRSGKKYEFAFGVRIFNDTRLLIDIVSPHHVSVSAKYVAFSDTRGEGVRGFAVYDRPLETEDTALLQQVADLVPIKSLHAGIRRELVH